MRLTARAGDDAQTAEILTRAFALAPLDDTATRLIILDALTAALARLGRWDDFSRRLSDARRMAPGDPRWALRERAEVTCWEAGRYDEAIAAARKLPPEAEKTLLTPSWHAAIAAAVKAQNWPARRALLVAAPAAGADRATIFRWGRFEFARFSVIATLTGHSGDVTGVAWAPDGARLATAGNDGGAGVGGGERAAAGDAQRPQRRRAERGVGARWGAAGHRQRRQTARVWEAASGRLLATLSGHSGDVTGVAWAPDGARLATASDDQTARVWEAASGRLLATLSGHSGCVTGVAWAPDGARLATASDDQTARVWGVGSSGRLLATLSGPGGRELSVGGRSWAAAATAGARWRGCVPRARGWPPPATRRRSSGARSSGGAASGRRMNSRLNGLRPQRPPARTRARREFIRWASSPPTSAPPPRRRPLHHQRQRRGEDPRHQERLQR